MYTSTILSCQSEFCDANLMLFDMLEAKGASFSKLPEMLSALPMVSSACSVANLSLVKVFCFLSSSSSPPSLPQLTPLPT
jgi:hypothetical protein